MPDTELEPRNTTGNNTDMSQPYCSLRTGKLKIKTNMQNSYQLTLKERNLRLYKEG